MIKKTHHHSDVTKLTSYLIAIGEMIFSGEWNLGNLAISTRANITPANGYNTCRPSLISQGLIYRNLWLTADGLQAFVELKPEYKTHPMYHSLFTMLIINDKLN